MTTDYHLLPHSPSDTPKASVSFRVSTDQRHCWPAKPGACLPELCFIYLFIWEAEQASDGAHGTGPAWGVKEQRPEEPGWRLRSSQNKVSPFLCIIKKQRTVEHRWRDSKWLGTCGSRCSDRSPPLTQPPTAAHAPQLRSTSPPPPSPCPAARGNLTPLPRLRAFTREERPLPVRWDGAEGSTVPAPSLAKALPVPQEKPESPVALNTCEVPETPGYLAPGDAQPPPSMTVLRPRCG